MPICSRCGAAYDPEDRYCPQCGGRLSPAHAAQTMSTQKSMDIADIQSKLGMVYFKKEDFLRAAEAWEKAIRNRPGDAGLKALIQDARSRLPSSEARP